jgi:hypothetical protein
MLLFEKAASGTVFAESKDNPRPTGREAANPAVDLVSDLRT